MMGDLLENDYVSPLLQVTDTGQQSGQEDFKTLTNPAKSLEPFSLSRLVPADRGPHRCHGRDLALPARSRYYQDETGMIR